VGWSPGSAGRRDTGCGDHRRGKCRASCRSGWDDHDHDLMVEAVTTSRIETRSSTELCTTRDRRRVSDRFVPRYVSRICRTDTRCHVFSTTGCRARAPPAWVDNPSRQIGCCLTRRASRATVTPSRRQGHHRHPQRRPQTMRDPGCSPAPFPGTWNRRRRIPGRVTATPSCTRFPATGTSDHPGPAIRVNPEQYSQRSTAPRARPRPQPSPNREY